MAYFLRFEPNLRKPQRFYSSKNLLLYANCSILCAVNCSFVTSCFLPCSKSLEEVAESPVAKQAPGFADFISPPKDSKKKRHLPIAPGRRGRAMSGDDGSFPVLVTIIDTTAKGRAMSTGDGLLFVE